MINIDSNIKYIFFDVDGVLSAPSYYDSSTNSQAIGFSDEDWNKYLDCELNDTYKYCKPIKQIYDFVKELLDNNLNTYVLSAVSNDIEANSKTVFLNKYYPNMFIENYYVKHDKDKALFIIDFCKKHNIDTSNCLLVDDTYSLLLDAHCKGIASAHLSNVLANNISK